MGFAMKFVTGLFVCAMSPSVVIAAQHGGIRKVKSVELSTYSEDITYIRTGPHAKHLAFVEGTKVYAYPVSSKGTGSIKELFDTTGMAPSNAIHGLAYMDSEKRFAAVFANDWHRMIVIDAHGRVEGERPITFPPGYTPGYVEGIDYIPPGAPASDYPDHLAMCSAGTTGAGVTVSNILIVTRNGEVVRQIPLPGQYPGCGAVAYRSEGQLLVTGYDGDWGVITIIDFSGNSLGNSPQRVDQAGEGLACLPDGTVLGGGMGGQIVMLDPYLIRKPEGDRTFRETQGLAGSVMGVAWNSGKHGFVLTGYRFSANTIYALHDLPTTFTGAAWLTDLYPRESPPYFRPRKLTYLPAEDLIGMVQPHSAFPYSPVLSIQLFHGGDGSHYGQINLEPALAGRGNPSGIAYNRSFNQFAVTLTGSGEAGKVHLVDRVGGFVRTIDYSGTIPSLISSVEFFPSATELLLSDGHTVYVGDLNGHITAQYPASDVIGNEGAISDLAAITTGEYAGLFAALRSGPPSSVTIFTFDESVKKK